MGYNVCSETTLDQKRALDIINIVVSILSLIGSSSTIIAYLHRQYKQRQVERLERSLIDERQHANLLGREGNTVGPVGANLKGSFNSYSDLGMKPTSKPPKSKLPYLVFMLAVSDLLTSIVIIISTSFLLGDLRDYHKQVVIGNVVMSPCVALRAAIQFWYMATFFWTTCISFYLYDQLSNPIQSSLLTKVFTAISFGIPFLITMTVTLTNSIRLDPTTGWCELRKLEEILLWFTPLLICMMICVFYYIRLRRLFREKFQCRLSVNDRLRQIDSTITTRLTLYILVFIIAWLPDIIQHFIGFFSTCSLYPLMVIQNLLVPSQNTSCTIASIISRFSKNFVTIPKISVFKTPNKQ
ncbi:cAMP receptor-like protein [Heterostelium album PN500]|uniref:cAMP receptor-like protein n=1 Tax=Heterostelium pallidum (strain ATCC 26659 / Pp 5 / PN500) TaxID=670386 RepID=D3BQF1_HETP5|nr:cAMP receptor-like protein [Heterostelium album PN500]EFA76371.1 cAMP receptor-like protein [Heterostelium album PN500]|eukprot:XP_020428503.1 cAMP receptor-like protein [Heterostelium album PN500]